MFNASSINPLVAFTGGFITFFASCLLPLVPTYLAFITGSSIQDQDGEYQRWKVVRHALFFVLGFVLTFIFFGFTLNRFSAVLQPYRSISERIGGVLFIVFGLFLAGLWEKSWFQREFKINMPQWSEKWTYLNAFIFGVVFSLGWTPCVGPLLAVILLWSAQQATMLQGLLLLTSFGLGLGTPFILTALLFETVMPWWKKSQRWSVYARKIAGVFILVSGVLLLSGQFQGFCSWFLCLFLLKSIDLVMVSQSFSCGDL